MRNSKSYFMNEINICLLGCKFDKFVSGLFSKGHTNSCWLIILSWMYCANEKTWMNTDGNASSSQSAGHYLLIIDLYFTPNNVQMVPAKLASVFLSCELNK